MAPVTVLTCVLQYLDGDDIRLAIVGWDGADIDTQGQHMRKAVIAAAGLEKYQDTIQSIRFVEIDLPVVEAIDPDGVVVTEVPSA